jgi:hypothetical protein
MISILQGGNVVSTEFSVSCEGGSGNSWSVGGGRDPDFALPPWLLSFVCGALGAGFHSGDSLASQSG